MSKWSKMMAGNLAEMLADEQAKDSLERLSRPKTKYPLSVCQESGSSYGGQAHTDSLAEIENITKQPNSAVEFDSGTRQLSSTAQQSNSAVELDSRAVELSSRTQQPNSAGNYPEKNTQPDSPAELSSLVQQPSSAVEFNSLEPLIIKRPQRKPLTSPAQKTLANYFAVNGKHVATYQVISDETGIPYGSVRSVLEKFTAHGWLLKTRWGGGRNSALELAPSAFLVGLGSVDSAVKFSSQAQQSNSAGYADSAVRLLNSAVELSSQNAPLMKIDREDLNLSISLEVIRTSWPNLAQSGFGVEQVNQIVANLTATGKPTSRIVQGLDHIEFELAHDQMVDKDGQKVSDPCSWAFKALAQNGYYRRPKGYVSPEEQAAKDAEEEARAVITARQKAEQVRFEAWRDGLSPDEMAKALKGHPAGPRDAWLKSVWKKNLTKK